ncbi:MAG: CPCC family cysteine-rich protein [Hyphomicrobiales bacterium]
MEDKHKFPCACCGHLVRYQLEYGSHNICVVCGWQDDESQTIEPDYAGGANDESLNEAKENYREIGAMSKDALEWVRKPKPEEIPPEVN